MSSSTTICQNIGPRQTRMRRTMGLLMFNLGLVMALVFVWQNASDMLRITVFIPFVMGYLGILQSMQKTCVVLALQGKQNLDQGNEAVDAALRRRLMIRSWWILFWAVCLALLCTYLTLAIHPEIMNMPRDPGG